MISAKVAKFLSGEYNENFNHILEEIQKAALAKKKEVNLYKSNHMWVNDIGYTNFCEVVKALGYEVFNNENAYKIRW
jgi:hypothetical protein